MRADVGRFEPARPGPREIRSGRNRRDCRERKPLPSRQLRSEPNRRESRDCRRRGAVARAARRPARAPAREMARPFLKIRRSRRFSRHRPPPTRRPHRPPDAVRRPIRPRWPWETRPPNSCNWIFTERCSTVFFIRSIASGATRKTIFACLFNFSTILNKSGSNPTMASGRYVATRSTLHIRR